MKKVKRQPKTPQTAATTINPQLIVGLGNPGPKYARTRHNAGFLVLDELARRSGASFRLPRFSLRKRLAEEAKLEGLTLIKPQTFMNLSGQAVQAYASKLRIAPEAILMVHDDLDLPLGKLRFKVGGGAGGQKGVADTIKRLGPDFTRLKLGIGRPPQGWKTEKWVLSKFREEELPLLEHVVATAADAVELLQKEGLEQAMTLYNGLDLAQEAKTSA